MIANYFPVWVVAVMGGSDGQISLVNTVTMTLMLGIGPWLGAVSDRMPRRLPILIATTTGCCLITFLVGNDLRSSLILFVGANLLVPGRDDHVRLTSGHGQHPENRGRVGGAAVGIGVFRVASRDRHRFHRLRPGWRLPDDLPPDGGRLLPPRSPLLSVGEGPARAVERLRHLRWPGARFSDIIATARRARSYPELVRFLVGRAFYAEAANTIGIFMAVYLTVQLGFSSGERPLAPGGDFGRRRRGVLLGPRR